MAFVLTALLLCVSASSDAAKIGHSEKLPCMGEVCLGESVRQLRDIRWIELPNVMTEIQLDISKESPPFYMTRSPLREHSLRLLGEPNYSLDVLAEHRRRMFANINGRLDLKALAGGLRLTSTDNLGDVGGSALMELASSRPAFCEFMQFVAHFRSKSGNPTTVVFMTVALSAKEHDLVVEYIGRRVAMPPEAGPAFEAATRRGYPDLTTEDDVRAKCGPAPLYICGSAQPGRTRSYVDSTFHLKWAAAEAATLRAHDYTVYYTRPLLGYADLELELSPVSPSWDQDFRQTWSYYAWGALAPARFPAISLSSNPNCVKPKAVVPSLE